ncbi:MAG: hypothetical protein E6K80_13555 [Candidatus Eisenbacteria bacterium]|uniref:DNA-directed DNA polymerase n=1 Tax=Eiseniibacteriota bacterium TaxID=2212470 RepID=A0A538TZ08_UNCEI|nr:MAG: hypothetical protein E6K80_13555 [Candidatus Eisenbacteria bacterium]
MAREAADPHGLRFELTEGAALLIAQKSEGSMRDAVSALDQVVSAGEPRIDEELVSRVLGIPDREAFFQLVESIVRRDPKRTLTALHQAFEKGIDPMELAQGLAEHLRHLLVLKVDPEASELVPATSEELERLRAQAEGWSEQDLLRLMKIAADLHFPMRDSTQPLVHLEAAVMQMATLEPGETLAQLLERLEALEKRLTGSASGPSSPLGSASSEPPTTRAAGATPTSPVRSAGRSAPPEPGKSQPTMATARATTAVIDDEAPRLDADVERRWQAAVEAINAQKRMLGAFLQESRIVGVTGSELVLAMDALHRSVVDERDNRGMVERVVAETFGTTLSLRCALDAVTPERPRPADLKPLVDRAIAWFEGDLIQPSGEAGRSER